MTFRVNQKVVCVDAHGSFGKLRDGQIYTVSDMGMFIGFYLIDLAEVETEVPHAWFPRRFRPLVESKTDISIFTKMLTDVKDKVKA